MRRLCIHHLRYDLQNLRMMQGGSEYPLESIEEVDLHDVVAQVREVFGKGYHRRFSKVNQPTDTCFL